MVQELLKSVLTAPVGAENRHVFLNRAPACCHVDGLAHQGGAHIIVHRITRNLLVQQSRAVAR